VGTAAHPKGKVMWQDTQFVCEMWGDEDDEIILAETTSLSSLGLSEASRLRFEYDVGDSAEVILKVEEKVGEMTAEAKSLPRVSKRFPAASSSSANKQKRSREEAGGEHNAMDLAFPVLSLYLLQKGRLTSLDLGRGCDAFGYWWAVIHNARDGFTCRSLEAMHVFDDMDETLLCFDRALVQHNQRADDDDNHSLLCAEVHPSTMKMKLVVQFKGFSIDSSSAAMRGSRQEVQLSAWKGVAKHRARLFIFELLSKNSYKVFAGVWNVLVVFNC